MIKKIIKEQPILEFLKENYSNKIIKKLLKTDSILVNNKVVKYDYILKIGDIVNINTYNKSDDIKIIYEDKDIIVVDKPNNLLTIKDDKNNTSLYELVSNYVKKNNKNNKIFIVHRLDRETSGIILFAKNIRIKKLLQDNWNDLTIERKYIALVHGLAKDNDILKSKLVEDNMRVYISNKGKIAITEYVKINNKNNKSLLDINIKTGRKNQIRVQLKDQNLPILGDKKYGIKDNYKRLYLHAYKLVIINPLNNKKMTFVTEIPDIFYLH